MQDNTKVFGILEITERNTETGEILFKHKDKNIITAVGMNQIRRSFTDSSHVNEYVSTVSLGSDTGGGTILNPTMPTVSITSAAHSPVYEVPVGEFFISYPTDSSVRFFATVNGNTVMSLYPGTVNVVYTSAMLKTASNKAFCYRRFSGRTISALISVDISWTIEFSQS